jgi:hypothetical protein
MFDENKFKIIIPNSCPELETNVAETLRVPNIERLSNRLILIISVMLKLYF